MSGGWGAGGARNENAAEANLDGVPLLSVRKNYFFLPAGFFAAVFLPAALEAVFFFAAISASPQKVGMTTASASILEIVNVRTRAEVRAMCACLRSRRRLRAVVMAASTMIAGVCARRIGVASYDFSE